jgi:hypothetical protein
MCTIGLIHIKCVVINVKETLVIAALQSGKKGGKMRWLARSYRHMFVEENRGKESGIDDDSRDGTASPRGSEGA